MANDFFIQSKNRHQFVKTRNQRRIGIYIDDIDREAQLTAQRLQLDEHVFAEVAVAPAVERKAQLTCPCPVAA